MDEINSEIVRFNDDESCFIFKHDEQYVIFRKSNPYSGPDDTNYLPTTTPNNRVISTENLSLADYLMADVELDIKSESFRENRFKSRMLAWYEELKDVFAKMSVDEMAAYIKDYYKNIKDWSYDLKPCEDFEYWTKIFGEETERTKKIDNWLSVCGRCQLNAIYQLIKAFKSANLAYVISRQMEREFYFILDTCFIDMTKRLIENQVEYNRNDYHCSTTLSTYETYSEICLSICGRLINEAPEVHYPVSFIGKKISVEALAGRNFYLYKNGKRIEQQPVKLGLDDLAEDLEYPEDVSKLDPDLAELFESYYWIKRINTGDAGFIEFTNIGIKINDDGVIENVEVVEERHPFTGGIGAICGVEDSDYVDYKERTYSDEAVDEIVKMRSGRYLSSDFSFSGKKLPKQIMEDCRNDRPLINYKFTRPSAYREAYVNMFINTDKNEAVSRMWFNTDLANANRYNSMFSISQETSNTVEEAADVLLYILDSYTDEEFDDIMG